MDMVLYGTEGCHLCEEAARILIDAGIEFRYRDIAENALWLERFATSIPVLCETCRGEQIGCPFDRQAVEAFFKRVSRAA